MASIQRVTYFKARIEDRPGALLAVLKDLKGKNIGLGGLWASTGEPGWTDLYVIPKNPEKVRDFWKGSPLAPEEGTAFFAKGTDRTGALLKALDAIAQAGVNLIRTDALAVGGKYGTFFLIAPADIERAGRALGAK
jgi:prephenate dehydratase